MPLDESLSILGKDGSPLTLFMLMASRSGDEIKVAETVNPGTCSKTTLGRIVMTISDILTARRRLQASSVGRIIDASVAQASDTVTRTLPTLYVSQCHGRAVIQHDKPSLFIHPR